MKRLFFISVQDKILFGLLVFLFLWQAAPSISYAHKVNIFAYVEGGQVYTESYFPDGRKVEGGTIEIYDSQGNKLLSGITDKEGKFAFTPPKRDDLKIVLIATMGHKNSYLLSASELLGIPAAGESKAESGVREPTAQEEPATSNTEQSLAVTESASQPSPPLQADLAGI